MSGRPPQEIWQESLDEGERRLTRSPSGLAATGFAGGVEILFGIVTLVIVTGAADAAMPSQLAHVLGATTFGIAFAFITIGRAELFTENFLIPVGAVEDGRGSVALLLRMWGITLLFNLVGLALFAAVFSVHGVLERSSLDAAGTLADSYADRGAFAAFVSAIAAGTVMTLFTWVAAAADTDVSRVILSLIIGFVLAVPGLNHAVVSFGEIVFGMIAGTSHANIGDLSRNLAIAIAGNLVGGLGLVFTTRLAQVRGEPEGRPAG